MSNVDTNVASKDNLDPKELSVRQLHIIRNGDLITNHHMAQKINISEKIIKRTLAILQEKDILS